MRVDFDNWKKGLIFVVPIRRFRPARMAESVDALVSNTNDSNVVPVRPRLRVQNKIADSIPVSDFLIEMALGKKTASYARKD